MSTEIRYGVTAPIGGLHWFDTPMDAARDLRERDCAVIRLLIDGQVRHGSAEDVKPIYDALAEIE